MLNIVVNEEKLTPTIGTLGSAGYDLYLSYDASITPGTSRMIGTGVKVAIPLGYAGIISPRSSTGKLGLGLANTMGWIDSDYRGEIMLNVKNTGTSTAMLYKYDRLFQMIVVPVVTLPINIVTTLDETERGEGGFGSTS